MRRTEFVLGLLAIAAVVGVALWSIASEPQFDVSPGVAPIATPAPGVGTLAADELWTDDGSAEPSPRDDAEPESTDVTFRLDPVLLGGATRIDVWIERDVAGEALPESSDLPPTLGEHIESTVREGTMVLPVDARTSALVFRAGERRARWDRRPGAPIPSEATIRSERGDAVRVRVRDASGRVLLGVPVVLVEQQGAAASARGEAALTGLPDGIALVRLAEPVRGRFRDLVPATTYYVGLGLPTAVPVLAPVPRDHDPAQVIELRAPAWGTLDVEVFSDTPSERDVARYADLALDTPSNPATLHVYPPAVPVRDGRATLRFVPPATPVCVRVFAEGNALHPARVRGVRVPPGGRVTVRVAAGREHLLVRGRIGGDVPPGTPVSVSLHAELGDAYGWQSLQPGEQEFELRLGGDEPPSFPLVLDAQAWASPASDRRSHGSARVELDTWPQSGVIDVGTIALSPLPLLVAGTVRDERGAPKGDQYLRVEWRDETGEWRRSSAYGSSATDGSFVILAPPPPGALRLVADAGSPEPTGTAEFEAGARGVDVAVTSREFPGSICASLRLPAGLSRALGWVRIVPFREDAPVESESERPATFDPATAVSQSAGRWSVSIGVAGRKEPLATADDVIVQSGATVSPSTLQDVEARVATRVVLVRVEDRPGHAAPLPLVWWRLADAPRTGAGAAYFDEMRPGPDGVLRLVCSADDVLEITATAQGSGFATEDRARGDVVLRLPPLTPRTLRVRVGGALAAAAQRARISVTPVWLGRDPSSVEQWMGYRVDPRNRGGAVVVRPEEVAELSVGADGVYGVVVSLSRRDSSGSFGKGIGLQRGFGAVLLSGDALEAAIVVDPTREEVEAALDRLDDALRGY